MTTLFDNRTLHRCSIALKRESLALDMLLDPGQLIDASIINQHLWEPYSTWAVERNVKPGMHCLDIGANIGYYTVLLSKLTGDTGGVYAFEPMAPPCALIQEHCYMNSCHNAGVWRIALSNRSGTEHKLFNYSWPPDRCVQQAEQIVLVTLDEWIAKGGAPRVDFIKLDVDGYERRILDGARRTLEAWRPTMLLEVCDYTLRQTDEPSAGPEYVKNTHARSMLESLASIGYLFYKEEDDSRLSIEDALQIRDLSISSINVICKHNGAEHD